MTTTAARRRRARPGTWEEPFLVALRETGNVAEACRAAGCGRTVVYKRRAADVEFARAMEDALDPQLAAPAIASAVFEAVLPAPPAELVIPPPVVRVEQYLPPVDEPLRILGHPRLSVARFAVLAGLEVSHLLERPELIVERWYRVFGGPAMFGGPVIDDPFGPGERCPACRWLPPESRWSHHAQGLDELFTWCPRQRDDQIREINEAFNRPGWW